MRDVATTAALGNGRHADLSTACDNLDRRQSRMPRCDHVRSPEAKETGTIFFVLAPAGRTSAALGLAKARRATDPTSAMRSATGTQESHSPSR